MFASHRLPLFGASCPSTGQTTHTCTRIWRVLRNHRDARGSQGISEFTLHSLFSTPNLLLRARPTRVLRFSLYRANLRVVSSWRFWLVQKNKKIWFHLQSFSATVVTRLLSLFPKVSCEPRCDNALTQYTIKLSSMRLLTFVAQGVKRRFPDFLLQVCFPWMMGHQDFRRFSSARDSQSDTIPFRYSFPPSPRRVILDNRQPASR